MVGKLGQRIDEGKDEHFQSRLFFLSFGEVDPTVLTEDQILMKVTHSGVHILLAI